MLISSSQQLTRMKVLARIFLKVEGDTTLLGGFGNFKPLKFNYVGSVGSSLAPQRPYRRVNEFSAQQIGSDGLRLFGISARLHHSSMRVLHRITTQQTNVSRQLYANCKWNPRFPTPLPLSRLPTPEAFNFSLTFQCLRTAHLSTRSCSGATSRDCTCMSGAIQQVAAPESWDTSSVDRLLTNIDSDTSGKTKSVDASEHLLSSQERRSCALQISWSKRCDMDGISNLFGSILVQNNIFSVRSVAAQRRALTTLSKSFGFRFISSVRGSSSSTSAPNTQATLSNNSSKGSGMPFDDEQEKLIANPKANKRIKINACGPLYTELSKTKPSLFSKAPRGKGIDFDVSYYDSLELLDPVNRSKAPIVCLLHGTPGHYKDFVSLINHMNNEKIRVIAPTFPDYSATFEHSFRHSPSERLDYLQNFFEALNITKIDMLIGHSSSVYTIFALLDHTLNSPPETNASQKRQDALQVKSLGLFNTPTYNLPPNLVVTPIRLLTLKLFDYPLVRPIMLTLIHAFVRLSGIRNKVDTENIEGLLIAASAVGYSECEKMSNHLKLITKFKIPTYLLIGCQDKLIPMRCFEQLKRDLGITNDQQVKQYHENGQLAKGASELNELVDVSQFASGGHYTFQKFSNQVNEDVCNFLRRRVIKLNGPAATSSLYFKKG